MRINFLTKILQCDPFCLGNHQPCVASRVPGASSRLCTRSAKQPLGSTQREKELCLVGPKTMNDLLGAFPRSSCAETIQVGSERLPSLPGRGAAPTHGVVGLRHAPPLSEAEAACWDSPLPGSQPSAQLPADKSVANS
jgi:hypothetical protein